LLFSVYSFPTFRFKQLMFVTDFSQYANLLRQKQKLSQEVLLSAFLPQNTADYTVTV
jgi:hypothetical protein